VYEFEDLRGEPIVVQFYAAELTFVKINRTEYLVDKILALHVRRCIREHLVMCRGYGPPSTVGFPLQTSGDISPVTWMRRNSASRLQVCNIVGALFFHKL
jgi:hypothetical protein